MNRVLDTWRRRAISIPAMFVATVVIVVTLPVLVGVALAADLATDRRWPRTRVVLMLAAYVVCETLGILAAFSNWLFSGAGPGRRARLLRRDHRLQKAWAGTLLAAARRTFGLQLIIERWPVDVERGPLLVLIRHTSLLDTLLPANLLSRRSGTRLRYVLKRQLLWDPCLDVVGNRLPNHFTYRSSPETRDEIASVTALAQDLEPDEGVLIYPEGTRFTPDKRRRLIERLSNGADPGASEDLAAQARRLEHVLPPRLGGTLALLEAAPTADVLVVAHHGFEGSALPRNLWRGRMIGQAIIVAGWRIAAAQIPSGREQRIDWLYEQWSAVDRWVAEKEAQ